MSARTNEAPRIFERHLQTALQVLLVGLLGGVFVTVFQLSKDFGRQDEKIASMAQRLTTLTDTITMLTSISDDRYREKDAQRDFELRDRAILAMDARMQNLEKAVARIVER